MKMFDFDFRVAAIAFALVLATGCVSQSTVPESSQTEAGRADDLLVVDCLLPGQLRKLGQSMTFLSPRRATRTTASDCEIRGGEYVAYDRASYATALKVWLPQAQEGDPAAQTYVGEIYEKGLGIQPDYAIALAWYVKAAEQGYSRAQINLGYLYESGLGVPRDLTTAMNWYRRASGLTDANLEYVSSVEIAQRQAAAVQTKALQGEVVALRGELDALNKELGQRKKNLTVSEREADKLKQQLAELKQRAATSQIAPVVKKPANSAEAAALRSKLEAAESERERLVNEIASEQVVEADLRQQFQNTNDELQSQREKLASLQQELETSRVKLQQSESGRAGKDDQAEAENLKLRARVGSLEDLVESQEKSLSLLKKAHADKQQTLQQDIAIAGQREADLQKKISISNTELATLRLQLSERDEAMAGLQGQLEHMQQESRHLEESLRASQEETRQLHSSLEKTEYQLDRHRLELQAGENEMNLLRKELARQKTVTSATGEGQKRIEDLEASIAVLDASLKKQIMVMVETEKNYAADKAAMSDKLSRMNGKAQELQLALDSSNQNAESLKHQLELSETQKSLSGKEIDVLEAQLRKQEAQIALQKQEIYDMQAKISRQSAGAAEAMPKMTALIEPVEVGPTIEIIEPPVTIMRGTPTVTLRSVVKKIDIVGKVSPADGIFSLKLNDRPQKTNYSGLFQASIDVQSLDTPVRVVAVDRQGMRSVLDFVIHPQSAVQKRPAIDTGKTISSPDRAVNLGNFYALVIGNNNYRNINNLRTARNDATAVADILNHKYGFETTVLLDADRYAMYSALEKFRKELTEEDNLLIYYAGHGEFDRVNQRGYWLPVDAEADSTANWVPNVAITDIINVMSAKHIMVIADSCYSGTLTRSSVARLDAGISNSAKYEWYKAMSKARTRIVLSSGGVQPVADSDGGEHSVFAAALLSVLQSNEGILEGYTLYRNVQSMVKSNPLAAKLKQDPQYSPIKYAGHEAGEFLFPQVGGSAYLERDSVGMAVAALVLDL